MKSWIAILSKIKKKYDYLAEKQINITIATSGVATIDATTHLRAQTNQQKILLHFVAKLQINL
jgi:hypothetical protein